MTTSELARRPWQADRGDGTYRNPVLHADFSDPDVVRVGEDFYLIASSFSRVPGLPVLHSRDLVNWRIVGHALDRLEPADAFAVPRPGCGVWAPALRHHAGRFWIFYPDPDRGIFVLTAFDPTGPWSRPRPLKTGRGLIDPCPLWDDDGRAYLVHAWAKSRSGFNNRITCHEISPDADALLDDGRTVIDGDQLPGYRTLEGPKFYKRDGWYWIWAPAGGVTHGWQAAFRSREIHGPYQERVVLTRGDTEVNGPHQGAWVDTPSGQDWFLHFQDRGPYGRVVHLQPVRWASDGWPVIGHHGRPVRIHAKPDVAVASVPAAPQASDDFTVPDLGLQWAWAANPDPSWWELVPPGGLRLTCVSRDDGDLRRLPNMLGQRLPAERFLATTTLALRSTVPGARAGLAVVGAGYAWAGVVRCADGLLLVCRTAEPGGNETDSAPAIAVPDGATVTLQLHMDSQGVGRFLAGPQPEPPRPIGGSFTATAGLWVGATLGLFAASGSDEAPPDRGHADIEMIDIRGVAATSESEAAARREPAPPRRGDS